jgi:HEAT repeat protein
MASSSRRRWALFAILAVLGAAALALGLRLRREGRREDASPPAGGLARTAPAETTRAGVPAGAAARWNIQPLPPEWDPSTANRLAAAAAAGPEELDACLRGLGPEAVPTLGAVLLHERDATVRRHVVTALGKLGAASDETTAALKAYLLLRVEEPDAVDELRGVIEALGKLQNQTSLQALVEVALRPELPAALQPLALDAIAAHPRGGAHRELFLDHLQQAPAAEARRAAAAALGRIRAAEAVHALVAALEREADAGVRQAIAGSLGLIGDVAALPPLVKAARLSAEQEVRLAAAEALQRIGGEEAMAALRSLLETERHPGVRRHLERWIRKGE